jgi:hypothetical protein
MNVKMIAAGAVGYVLGRTKKGKAAVRLALWASGRDATVKDAARAQAVKFLSSPEGRKLVAQARGPVLESGKKLALSAYERGVGTLTQDLSHRTSDLRQTLADAPAAELGGKAGALTGSLTSAIGRWGEAASGRGGKPTQEPDQESGTGGGRDAEPAPAASESDSAGGGTDPSAGGTDPSAGGKGTSPAGSQAPDGRDTPRSGGRRHPSRHRDYQRDAGRRQSPLAGGQAPGGASQSR